MAKQKQKQLQGSAARIKHLPQLNADIFAEPEFGDETIDNSLREMQQELKAMTSILQRAQRARQMKCYMDLSHAYYRLMKYDNAEFCALKHLEIAKEKKVNDRKEQKVALTTLGCVLKRKMLYEEALQVFKEALDAAEEIGDQKAMGRVLNNMGNIYELTADFESSMECFQRRVEISSEIGDTDSEIKAYASIAELHNLQGELRESITYFEKVIINLRMKVVQQQNRDLQAKADKAAAEIAEALMGDGEAGGMFGQLVQNVKDNQGPTGE